MNSRRSFISNLGVAVAATMLPFGFKFKLQAPKKPKAVTLVSYWFETRRASVATDAGYREFIEHLARTETKKIVILHQPEYVTDYERW